MDYGVCDLSNDGGLVWGEGGLLLLELKGGRIELGRRLFS